MKIKNECTKYNYTFTQPITKSIILKWVHTEETKQIQKSVPNQRVPMKGIVVLQGMCSTQSAKNQYVLAWNTHPTEWPSGIYLSIPHLIGIGQFHQWTSSILSPTWKWHDVRNALKCKPDTHIPGPSLVLLLLGETHTEVVKWLTDREAAHVLCPNFYGHM